MKKKNIFLAAVSVSMLMTFQPVKALDASSWTELQQSIQAGTSVDIKENITNDTGSDLGNLGGSNVTINGNGYDINGNGNAGITVNSGQTLNINNVGSLDSNGFNGFYQSNAIGGIINNHGTANITDSTFSNNSAKYGGAIFNNTSTATITDSTFSNNSAGSNGGAIFNNASTATITDSTFSNNSAGSNGGAIFNNTSTATITDSTFSNNSANTNGGAIFNYGILNIIADKENTTFTGNNVNGVSNALYNRKVTTNLNAGGANIVFNDAISGDQGTIIINNTGVKMADGTTDAPTNGVVEFNNTVSGNTIYLYNGTLKLGHYAGGIVEGKNVAESWGNFDNSVTLNLNGGTLDTLDGAIRDYTVGTLNGSGGKLALDMHFSEDGAAADNFIINGGNATLNFSNINFSGDLPSESGRVQIVSGNVSNITLGNYGLFTNDASIIFAQDTTDRGALAYTYNKGQGGLKAAVDYSGGNRQYDMNANETITSDLGVMGGENSTLTITGNGYDINGNGQEGITVNKGQSLNVNNVGSNGSNGFNGFYNNRGGVIDNDGTVNIAESVFSNNHAEDFGGVIDNYGTVDITKSIFSNNYAEDFGGVIVNNGLVTITDSIFRDNSTGGEDGAINNNGTAIISNSIFSNNSASDGGAIRNTSAETTMTISDSTFTGNSAGDNGGAIYNYGTANIIADKSDTTFTGNTDSTGSNALYNSYATTNLNAGGANIVFNDGIDGENGIININGVNEINGVQAPTSGTVVINNEVKNNTVNMYDGTLLLGTNTQNGILYSGTFADSVNFNYTGGIVSLQNNGINSANLGNLTLNKDMDLRMDANFADKTIDTITASSFMRNDHNINISNITILQPTTEKSFSMSPLGSGMNDSVKTALAGAIQYTGGDAVYSPIYKYSASYDPETAMLNFGLYGNGGDTPGYESYNPAVMASPVAAQLGGYLVQLNSYDNAFRNMDMYMLMTKEQRQAMKLRNKYAALNNANIVFDPTVTMYENKAGWFRPYATFENVSLNNGPKVSNVAYGSFFGAESELYDLGHGWDGMWGVYGGYNGSHQAYDGVSIYQNGGTLGAVGMAYKGNFFTGLTANVGASAGEASSMFGREDFAMLMSGVASKTGYNWELAKGKFIIQPSLLMSYSFINTFDYKNAAGVSINSDPLHAIQLEPGIKFIGNLKNGWQPYAGVSVVWNIMDRTQFQANDVALPNLSIDPFVKYGVGVRKAWGERFTGFFQTYITNGGRNGVGLQCGFRWTLGKDKQPEKKATGKVPELPKAKVTLNNIR